jgi:hypothetical protein
MSMPRVENVLQQRSCSSCGAIDNLIESFSRAQHSMGHLAQQQHPNSITNQTLVKCAV